VDERRGQCAADALATCLLERADGVDAAVSFVVVLLTAPANAARQATAVRMPRS
jgi:hypothetical protein